MKQPSFPPLKKILSGMVLGIILCLMSGICAAGSDSLTGMEAPVADQKRLEDSVESSIHQGGAPPDKSPAHKNSLESRLAKGYLAPPLQVPLDCKKAAIEAYNRGVDETAQAHDEAAIEDYQEALRLNPGMIQAYNNLGALLEQLSRHSDAMQIYKMALQQAPGEALLYRNLGVVYETTGNISEALNLYRQYLTHTASPDPAIADRVATYEHQHQYGMQTPEYVAAARSGSQGESLLWPRSLNPIPVFIRKDPGQVAFLPALHAALRQWESVSQGHLQFRETDNPQEARIRIKLQEGPLAHPDMEVGHATYDIEEDAKGHQRQLSVSIIVNTGEHQAPIPLEDRLVQVRRLALHEVGHAIGIWGHSDDPDDIMFSHPIVSQLSSRDILTLQRLYADPSAEKAAQFQLSRRPAVP